MVDTPFDAGPNPEGVDYPFVAPSSDIRDLIADCHVAHRVEAVLPLRIDWIYGLHNLDASSASAPSTSGSSGTGEYIPIHPVDVVIVDAHNTIVFDSLLATYRAVDFSSSLLIHEWLVGGAGVCRIVQHRTSTIPPAHIHPDNAILDERCSVQLPPALLGIRVGDDVLDATEIRFINGYNSALVVGESAPLLGSPITIAPAHDVENVTKVTLTANPADGIGRYPGCDSAEQVIRSINGATPDKRGNLIFTADDCYALRPVSTLSGNRAAVTAGQLKFTNFCGPRCEATDVVNTYKAMRQLHRRYQDIAQRYSTYRTTFANTTTCWESEAACRAAQPLKLAATAVSNYLDLVVAFCNLTADDKQNLYLYVEFVPLESSASSLSESSGPATPCEFDSIVPLTTFVTVNDTKPTRGVVRGTWPLFWLHFDLVKAYRAAVAQFRLEFDCQSLITRFRIDLSANVDGGTITQTANQIVEIGRDSD